MAIRPLKDEIANDPMGIGYAGMTDQEVADSLNTAKTLEHPALTAPEIYEAIYRVEFDALSAGQKSDIDRILGLAGDIRIDTAAKARGVLLGAFGGGTASRTDLIAAATYEGSRGIEIGVGRVRVGDVSHIRSL